MLVLDPDSQQAASSFPGLLVYFAFSASEKRARSGTTTQTFELSKNGKIPGEGAAAASAIIVVVLQRRQKRRSCGHSTIIIAQISHHSHSCVGLFGPEQLFSKSTTSGVAASWARTSSSFPEVEKSRRLLWHPAPFVPSV